MEQGGRAPPASTSAGSAAAHGGAAFLCIGARKCGTTWLASAVAQHPEVGRGRTKELHFLDQRAPGHAGLDSYERQFRTTPATRAVGEFTPIYWRTVGTETPTTLLGPADRVATPVPTSA